MDNINKIFSSVAAAAMNMQTNNAPITPKKLNGEKVFVQMYAENHKSANDTSVASSARSFKITKDTYSKHLRNAGDIVNNVPELRPFFEKYCNTSSLDERRKLAKSFAKFSKFIECGANPIHAYSNAIADTAESLHDERKDNRALKAFMRKIAPVNTTIMSSTNSNINYNSDEDLDSAEEEEDEEEQSDGDNSIQKRKRYH